MAVEHSNLEGNHQREEEEVKKGNNDYIHTHTHYYLCENKHISNIKRSILLCIIKNVSISIQDLQVQEDEAEALSETRVTKEKEGTIQLHLEVEEQVVQDKGKGERSRRKVHQGR